MDADRQTRKVLLILTEEGSDRQTRKRILRDSDRHNEGVIRV
jgi:hypothetical protein